MLAHAPPAAFLAHFRTPKQMCYCSTVVQYIYIYIHRYIHRYIYIGLGMAVVLSRHVSIRQHTSAYVSIRQHTSAFVSIRQHTSACVSIRQHASAYVSIRQHTSACVSAYVSIRQHMRFARDLAPAGQRACRGRRRRSCPPSPRPETLRMR